nr:uncharacterized transcriptional regulatory protein [Verruciconidia persicina]
MGATSPLLQASVRCPGFPEIPLYDTFCRFNVNMSDEKNHRLPVNPRRHKVAPEHRKRVATATKLTMPSRLTNRCNNCNLRRTKCSGDQPCTQCASSARECVYPVPTVKVSISRDELDELKRKVEAYEKALQDAIPDVEKRRELVSQQSTTTTFGSPSESSSSQQPQQQQHAYQQQQHQRGMSPSKTEMTSTTDEDSLLPGNEGRLLHDSVGTARFHGETSEIAFVDSVKSHLRSLLSPSELATVRNTVGRCHTSDSKPLPSADADAFWLPPPQTSRAMLAVLRSFIQDGSDDSPLPSGGIFWWGDLSSTPSVPISSGHVETDIRSARRLAFYQTALGVACRIASTRSPGPGPAADRSDAYFARAAVLVGNPLDVSRCSVGEVAVLTLMGYYLVETDRREAASLYISLATRISMGLGVHRGNVDERGKRIFWTLYVLDRWVSCLTGRPPSIPDEAIRLSLPADSQSMPPAAGLKAHVQLARISSFIVCNVYQVAPSRHISFDSAVEQSMAMLEQWQKNLPPSLQMSPEGLSTDPAACMLQMHFNHLIIHTLRPSLLARLRNHCNSTAASRGHASQQASSSCSASPSAHGSTPPTHYSEALASAAQRNMRLARHVATLHRPRRLLHSGLHFVLTAVLCFQLQALLGDETAPMREVDFAIELFERESQTGNSYGFSAASALKDIRSLMVMVKSGSNFAAASAMELDTSLDQTASWITGEMEHDSNPASSGLYEEVLSWMDQDWSGWASAHHSSYTNCTIQSTNLHAFSSYTPAPSSATMALARTPIRSIGTSLPFLSSRHTQFPSIRLRPISTTSSLRTPEPPKRTVVGSFLLKRDAADGRPKVALFRRTDKVNTYKGKYATISGGEFYVLAKAPSSQPNTTGSFELLLPTVPQNILEANNGLRLEGVEPSDQTPLHAAHRELLEETTLDSTSSLRFLCRGKPYSFIDHVAHYEWSVYPFAFTFTSPEAEASIRLGEEHDSTFQWFDVDGFPPREQLSAGLVESLRRVWPVEGRLSRVDALSRYILREDPQASETSTAFTVFNRTVAERLSDDKDEYWRLARLAAWHIWNNSDESLRVGVLGRLIPALELLQELLAPQNEELAPEFETLAAIALHNVDLQTAKGREASVDGEEERRHLTEMADRYFTDLWAVPEDV